MALEAVLFDMDGTLLDSEKVWEIALHDLAAVLGGRLSSEARARMVGGSMETSMAIMHDDLGVDLDPAISDRFLTARMFELFATDLIWKPGAQKLVTAVHDAGLPSAVVTATHRPLTDVALAFMGAELFTASVCGDEVVRSKPAPEPYLRAAELLGVAARDCVAIEDSPTGIASAERAGCMVIAVPSELPIAAAPTRTVLTTLDGVDVEDLRRLASGS